jgi:hypothetical protein
LPLSRQESQKRGGNTRRRLRRRGGEDLRARSRYPHCQGRRCSRNDSAHSRCRGSRARAQLGRASRTLLVDRVAAGRYSLTPERMGETLQALIGGVTATTVLRDQIRTYPVRATCRGLTRTIAGTGQCAVRLAARHEYPAEFVQSYTRGRSPVEQSAPSNRPTVIRKKAVTGSHGYPRAKPCRHRESSRIS